VNTTVNAVNIDMSLIAEMKGTQDAIIEKSTDQAADTIVRVAKAVNLAITVGRDTLRNSLKLLLNNSSQRDKFLPHKAEFTCHHLK